MHAIAYASLKISGQIGTGTSVTVRVLLVIARLALTALLVALRSHKWLQLAVVLPTLLITSFYVIAAQIAASGGAPQHTYAIPKAPASCLAPTADAPVAAFASSKDSEPEDLGYPIKRVAGMESGDR